MKVEAIMTEQEQNLLDYQQVPIRDLGLYPQLSEFLHDQGLDRVAPLLSMNVTTLSATASLQEDAAEYLLQQIDHYFDNQPIIPFVCPTLPPDCFQKSLDVLDLAPELKSQLEKFGIHRLGLLASLEPGENNPMIKTVQEALTRYIHSYRATTESADASAINVSYKNKNLWGLPHPVLPENKQTPLSSLDLPPHLHSYVSNLGIEWVEQLSGLSHQEMKLLLGLENDAIDFLFTTVNQPPTSQTPPATVPQVSLPDFCEHITASDEQRLFKYGRTFPVLNETILRQLLVDQHLLSAEQAQEMSNIEVMAAYLVPLWDQPLNTLTVVSEQEHHQLSQVSIQTFGQLLEAILAYNLLWLKENTSEEESPPNLGLTPLLVYLKHARENKPDFLEHSWIDSIRHLLVRFYQWITRKKV